MSGRSVVALLEVKKPYQILKTQSFDVLEEELEVTYADEATRTVHSFNGKPAAAAYAEAVGCSVEELPSKFQSNPVGLVTAQGDPFVRSPQQIQGDDVVFCCQIKEGMKLKVLRARDIVEDTDRGLRKAVHGDPHGRVLDLRRVVHRTRQPDVDDAAVRRLGDLGPGRESPPCQEWRARGDEPCTYMCSGRLQCGTWTFTRGSQWFSWSMVCVNPDACSVLAHSPSSSARSR